MASGNFNSMISDARRISTSENSFNLPFNEEIKNKIFSNLQEDDLWKLKLLLYSFQAIRSDVARISTFDELYLYICRSVDDNSQLPSLLAELLHTIKRFDLLKLMGCCKHRLNLQFQTQGFSHLDPRWKNEYKRIENSSIEEGDALINNIFHGQQNSSRGNDLRSDQQGGLTSPIPSPVTPPQTPNISVQSEILPQYPWRHSPCGYALIINNEKFARYENRNGSTQDKEKLKAMFENFDFVVETRDDLTADSIRSCISVLTKKNYEEYDAFALCILSHGILDKVLGVDGNAIHIERDIIFPFTDNRVQSLILKPKLFFIQACQGLDNIGSDRVDITTDNGIESGIESDAPEFIPKYGDYIKVMPTIPGYVAYRSKSKGSWFIHHLTSVLNQRGHQDSLLTNLTEVQRRISEEKSNGQDGMIKQQRPFLTVTLTKTFVFKKKQLPVENEFGNFY